MCIIHHYHLVPSASRSGSEQIVVLLMSVFSNSYTTSFSWAFSHTHRICNLIDSLISWVHSFTESYLSDIDNIVASENTTRINQNKRMQSRLIRLIGVVFLSVSYKYD